MSTGSEVAQAIQAAITSTELLLKPSRERSLVVTKLEEAMFWTIDAINKGGARPKP